jgi:hypothetical protein
VAGCVILGFGFVAWLTLSSPAAVDQ